jgi:hypothetical protein
MSPRGNRSHVPNFRSSRPDLECFDALPPAARRALANAAFNWASDWFWQGWRRKRLGCETGTAIATTVAKWDREQIEQDRRGESL